MIQNVEKKKTRNIVDVVFCIDASHSMRTCIDGVRENINRFVSRLQGTENRIIDYRLAILAHDWKIFRVLDFTGEIPVFQEALNRIETRWEEFTLPAIDWCLDLDWRHGCHKVIVVFTDETLQNNHDPEFQMSQFEPLRRKIMDAHVMLWLIAPHCIEYQALAKVPRAEYVVTGKNQLLKTDFTDLLARIGKTISASLGNYQQSAPIPKDIYKMKGNIEIHSLAGGTGDQT